MNELEIINNFLTEAHIFYLSTVENNKPKCRPIGFHKLQNGNIYFAVGTFKEVYKQLQKNQYVEICACKGSEFLRYYGKAVFEENESMAVEILENSPGLQKIYNSTTGHKLGVFHLEDSIAEFHVMSKLKTTFNFK